VDGRPRVMSALDANMLSCFLQQLSKRFFLQKKQVTFPAMKFSDMKDRFSLQMFCFTPRREL